MDGVIYTKSRTKEHTKFKKVTTDCFVLRSSYIITQCSHIDTGYQDQKTDIFYFLGKIAILDEITSEAFNH
ncbi:MAG: hypothetical protein B6I31_02640 [Desulfobacteraceae bacterium 4572_19]|nr:MAG: hypothetical protein B6I31_02640 [Desulfobacteraceae bacterium 4572_19]